MHSRGSVGIFNWWVPKCCAFAKKDKKLLKLSNYWTSFDSFCKINGFENLFLKIDGFQEPIKPLLTEPLQSHLPDRKPIQILISTIQWKILQLFFSFLLSAPPSNLMKLYWKCCLQSCSAVLSFLAGNRTAHYIFLHFLLEFNKKLIWKKWMWLLLFLKRYILLSEVSHYFSSKSQPN